MNHLALSEIHNNKSWGGFVDNKTECHVSWLYKFVYLGVWWNKSHYSLFAFTSVYPTQKSLCLTSHTHTTLWLHHFQLIRMCHVCFQFKYCSILMKILFICCPWVLVSCSQSQVWKTWPCQYMSVCLLEHITRAVEENLFIIPWLWRQALSKCSTVQPCTWSLTDICYILL